MSLRKKASAIYHRLLHIFIYNKIVEDIFFAAGYKKNINGEIILVPFRFSWFYPSIYEPEKTHFIKTVCKEGDTVIDVGAHIGIFSCLMAKMVGKTGRVISFEPAPFTFDILKKTIAYNGMDNITAQQAAVSSMDGTIDFYLYDNSKIANGNSTSRQNTTGNIKAIKVKCITLDSLLQSTAIQKLSLIKIDAEGAEYEILMGAQKIIKKFTPFITLEIHPKAYDNATETLSRMYTYIHELGYKIYYNNNQLSKEVFSSFNSYIEVILSPASILNLG